MSALHATVERVNELAATVELPVEHLDAIRSEEMRASLAEVTAAAAHLEAVIAGAERLLGSETFEQAAPRLEAAAGQVGEVGEGLIDKAFVAGVKLIAIFLISLLVTLLTYRFLARNLGGKEAEA